MRVIASFFIDYSTAFGRFFSRICHKSLASLPTIGQCSKVHSDNESYIRGRSHCISGHQRLFDNGTRFCVLIYMIAKKKRRQKDKMKKRLWKKKQQHHHLKQMCMDTCETFSFTSSCIMIQTLLYHLRVVREMCR